MLARERWEEMKWEGRGFNPCECVSWCTCTTTEQVSRIPGTGNQEEFQFSQEFRLSLSLYLQFGRRIWERERERGRNGGNWLGLGGSWDTAVYRLSQDRQTRSWRKIGAEMELWKRPVLVVTKNCSLARPFSQSDENTLPPAKHSLTLSP